MELTWRDWPLSVVRSARRRTWAIQVKPGPRLELRLPLRTPGLGDPRSLLDQHAPALLRALDREARRGPRLLDEPWLQDGRFRWQGVWVPCEVRRGRGARWGAEGSLSLGLSDPADPARVEAALLRALRGAFTAWLEVRLAQWAPAARALGLRPWTGLSVRVMTSRWGSCSARGALCFNLRLAGVDPALADYVIAHELAHLKELNHSPRFYGLLSRLMPDWKRRRQRLQALGAGTGED